MRICKSLLNEISRANAVPLCWVPGHMDIKRKWKGWWACYERTGAALIARPPFCSNPNQFLTEKDRRWSHRSSKQTLGSSGRHAQQPGRYGRPTAVKRSTSLVKLSRYNARVVSGIITGHCAIGVHAERLGVLHNDFCRSCRNEEEIQSVRHLLCDCPALSVIRMRTLGSYFFSELEDLGNVKLTDLLRFISLSGWF